MLRRPPMTAPANHRELRKCSYESSLILHSRLSRQPRIATSSSRSTRTYQLPTTYLRVQQHLPWYLFWNIHTRYYSRYISGIYKYSSTAIVHIIPVPQQQSSTRCKRALPMSECEYSKEQDCNHCTTGTTVTHTGRSSGASQPEPRAITAVSLCPEIYGSLVANTNR